MTSDSDPQSVADDARVVVTFASSNRGPHSSIPARRIALRHNIPERIGRASKTVYIKDIGSLHGTFIAKNDTSGPEKRLDENEAAELASGDKIRFGIEILRGRETFPPCEVDVTMEWLNTATSLHEGSASTNHFTVPDAEDDDMMSDSGSVMMMEKEDFTLPALPDVNPPDEPMVVDLTQEADPNANGRARHGLTSQGLFTTESSSDVIDLTSEIDEDERSSIRGYSPDPSNWPNQPASPAILVHDLEDTQETCNPRQSQDSSVSATASMNQSSETSGESIELHHPPTVISDLVAQQAGNIEGFNVPMPMPSYIDTEDEGEDDDSLMSDELDCQGDSDDSSEDEADMDSHWSSDDDDVEAVDEHTNSDDSEGEDASDLDEPCDTDILSSSDSESDLIETSIFDKTSTSTQSPKSSPVATTTHPILKLDPVYPHLHSCRALFSSSSNCESLPATAPPNLMNNLANDITHNLTALARQPSPSDAAMVKMPASGSNSDAKTTAQALGEKTGKMEYFNARDGNKVIMQAGPAQLTPDQYTIINQESNALPSPFKADDSSYNIFPSSPAPSQQANNNQGPHHPDSNAASKAPWRTNLFQPQPVAPPCQAFIPRAHSGGQPLNIRAVQRQRSFSQQDADLHYTAPIWATSNITSSFHGHISPDSEKRTRFQSPEHDMTSAFAFQKSKQAAINDANEIKVMRNTRRMTIPDLLAQDSEKASSPLYSPPSPSPPSMSTCRPYRPYKRPFDEVSEDDEDFETTSMVSQPVSATSRTLPVVTKDTVATASVTEPSAASQDTVGTQGQVSKAPTSAPPAKRRRLADFAACAIGGAIGGAAVLVGLITSAPSISQM
ncbi:forkhead associated domain (FHA) and phosphopeptide binding site containing protein [Apiospora saccharicola]|uniref:Forkhead associated domain (FHA) and phosphopeptide binding site containing protein n=1 Tax=Apiospora saccharicola TaxID=335842 RepID=A0ABR1VBF0_9PEZI